MFSKRTLKGGFASGFREVKPEEYQPRLLLFCKEGKVTYMREVSFSKDSIHSGDVFILDMGTTAYQFNGSTCSAFEKSSVSETSSFIPRGSQYRFVLKRYQFDLSWCIDFLFECSAYSLSQKLLRQWHHPFISNVLVKFVSFCEIENIRRAASIRCSIFRHLVDKCQVDFQSNNEKWRSN